MPRRKPLPQSSMVVHPRDIAPLATVLPEIATVLDDIQVVVATEVRRYRHTQAQGMGLDADATKSLGTLTTALVQSEKAKRELSSQGVAELSDAELIAQLEDELVKLRNRKPKQ